MQRHTILCIIYEAGNVSGALALARHYQVRQDRRVILWSPYHLPETDSYREQAMALGAEYVYEATPQGGDALPADQLGMAPFVPVLVVDCPAERRRLHYFRRAAALLAWCWRGWRLGDYSAEVARLKRSIAMKHAICQALDVIQVILPEDNIRRDSAQWIAAARLAGTRSSILTYGVLSVDEAEKYFRRRADHYPPLLLGWLCRLLLPWWVRPAGWRYFLPLPLAPALAHEALGLTPRDPWVVNTGAYDRIAVESEKLRDDYIRIGVDRFRVVVIGHPQLDRIHTAGQSAIWRRGEFLRRQGLPEDTRIIVCALPPNQYPGWPAPDFADYDALVTGWLDLLGGIGKTALIVSLHPSAAPSTIRLLQQRGVCCVTGGVADVLPVADIYVACFSSTIKWALALGIPTINYDCYRFGFPDYDGEPGIGLARQPEEVRRMLVDLLQARGGKPAETARPSAYWGLVDGKSLLRLEALLELF